MLVAAVEVDQDLAVEQVQQVLVEPAELELHQEQEMLVQQTEAVEVVLLNVLVKLVVMVVLV